MDTWQAVGVGTYPIQEQDRGQDEDDLRRNSNADEEGRCYYTFMPKPHTSP